MVYGVALSVQATIYNAFLLFQSLLQHLKDNEDVVTDDFVKVGIEFFTGQGMEIYSRDVEQCPTFEDYGVVVYGSKFNIFGNQTSLNYSFLGFRIRQSVILGNPVVAAVCQERKN